MKKALILLLALLLITPAFAETYPPATEPPTREYTYDDYYTLILQDGDLEPSILCQTIWAMIDGAVGEKDTIREVSLDNGTLTITVTWPDDAPSPLTNGMYAQTRASSITDAILDYEELDEYWTSLHLVFPGAEATFTPDMAQDDGYGRYIDLLLIMEQIPD